MSVRIRAVTFRFEEGDVTFTPAELANGTVWTIDVEPKDGPLHESQRADPHYKPSLSRAAHVLEKVLREMGPVAPKPKRRRRT